MSYYRALSCRFRSYTRLGGRSSAVSYRMLLVRSFSTLRSVLRERCETARTMNRSGILARKSRFSHKVSAPFRARWRYYTHILPQQITARSATALPSSMQPFWYRLPPTQPFQPRPLSSASHGHSRRAILTSLNAPSAPTMQIATPDQEDAFCKILSPPNQPSSVRVHVFQRADRFDAPESGHALSELPDLLSFLGESLSTKISPSPTPEQHKQIFINSSHASSNRPPATRQTPSLKAPTNPQSCMKNAEASTTSSESKARYTPIVKHASPLASSAQCNASLTTCATGFSDPFVMDSGKTPARKVF